MKNFYNTIIIGAGAAGLTAGRYLKDALILDKKKEIGRPVQSGEGISHQALERLGIKPDFNWISSTVNIIKRITPKGKTFGRFQKNLGYILDKSLFEKFLANQCQAQILLNTEVINLGRKDNFWEIETKNGRIFKSKYLIGADGTNSIVRRKIFQEKLEILPAVQYLVEVEKEIESSIAKIYLDNEKFPQGYAWIFSKSNKTANIGLGGKGNLSEKFKDFLEKEVRKNYGNFKLLENRSGIVSLGGTQSKISKDNILLVGDAAGLADPIFLGGISQAMSSGRIAAQSILKNEVALYEKKIKSMPFADSKLIKARKILYSFSNQILNELGEVLEGRGTTYLKTPAGIWRIISKPNLRRNFLNIYKFFFIWWKTRDYLW